MQIFTYLIASLSHNITSRKEHENISYSHNTLIIIKKIFTFFSSSIIRMSEKSIKCGDEKANKINFCKNKKPI